MTIILFFCLTGFLFFYFTSGRAVKVYQSSWTEWVGAHPATSKQAAFGFFTVSIVLAVLKWGLLGGFFSFLVILMTMASLVFLFQPMKLFKPRNLILMTVFIAILELII